MLLLIQISIFLGTRAENYDFSLAKGFKKVLVIEDAAHTYECSKNCYW
jgi:hypothetical protein